MKLGPLRSIAHNIADSLASGCGLMIGLYDMDVFGEASRSPDGYLEVDFLACFVATADPTWSMTRIASLYAAALPALCEKQGASSSDFRMLKVRYHSEALGRRFVVTVEDREGRRAIDEYMGSPGRRPRVVASLGRVRTQRGSVLTTENARQRADQLPFQKVGKGLLKRSMYSNSLANERLFADDVIGALRRVTVGSMRPSHRDRHSPSLRIRGNGSAS